MDFVKALDQERTKNVLTQFYINPQFKKKDENLSPVQRALKSYTHEQALQFAAASVLWKDGKEVKVFPKIQAYYKAITEKKKGDYVLEACHANVHGTHRGDLRFIAVNAGTTVQGVTESMKYNGRLWPGDVVAVTELKRIKKFEIFPISKITHDTPCVWMASIINILPRRILEDITFTPQDNGTHVIEGGREVLNLCPLLDNLLIVDKLYKGSCFVPQKMEKTDYNFTSDHNENLENQLIKECSKIHASPNSLGTIFKWEQAPELSKMFNVGWDACNKRVSHPYKPSNVIELCTLMGYSAAVSLGNGRNDSRSFPMGNVQREGDIVHFTIENPEENPTDGKWMIKTRIEIRGNGIKSNAIIDSIIPEGRRRLKIAARLSREVKKHLKFTKGIHVVCQQEAYEVEGLRTGFCEKIPKGSNGHRILKTLYGGQSIFCEMPEREYLYRFNGNEHQITLNEFQGDYVEMLQSKTPMVVGSSPFGCGKSLTIVTAAQSIYEDAPGKVKPKQLLITQSNYASVNLVDIASKLNSDSRFKFVRYLSEKNFEEFPDECLTEHDIQNLMKLLFSSWAKGDITSKHLKPRDLERMLNFVLFRKLVEPGNLSGEALAMYNPRMKPRKPFTQDLRKAFFILHNPDVIMTTADSLPSLLNADLLKSREICTIQIDEASQLPEHTLIRLLTLFPYANYGLIGDIQQLPPYCETGLEGKLKDYGIGNTMERAVKEKLFPQAMLREVYRCHPKITNLLSGLFYDGRLISGITEKDRSEFMTKRPDFWPESKYPVLIVNNEDHGKRMGTSCGNKSEVQIVKNLLHTLTSEYNGYQLQPANIGVISFYAAQTSVLTDALRSRKVKCGTVDAFQGTERDVIILCCTNEKISEFMQLSNRINVAMSRAKQVTIIVGNVVGLKKAKYWGTIVKKAKANGGVIEADSLQNVHPENNRPDSSRSRRSKKSSTEKKNITISSDDSTDHLLTDAMEKLVITARKKCCVCEEIMGAAEYPSWKKKCNHKVCHSCFHSGLQGKDIWEKCFICPRK